MAYLLGAIALLAVSDVVSATLVPGAGIIMQGYDYIFGNPLEGAAEDPGYREDIFNKVSSPNTVSWDTKTYNLPWNISGSCELKCEGKYTYSDMVSMTEYYNMLYQHVQMSHHGMFDSFSMSETYKKVQESIVYNKNIAITNYEVCAQCQLQMDKFTKPSFTSNFAAGLNQMPSQTNDNWFFNNWFPTFGTHFINYTELGAAYGIIVEMDYYAYESYSSSNLDIEVSASAFADSVAGCSQTDTEKQEANYFKDESLQVITFNVGASLPQDYSPANWQKEVEAGDVGAITIHIDWIYNLITDANKKKALQHATQNYCAYLKKSNPQLQCSGSPPPPNPNPDNSVFGGFYSLIGGNKNEPNPYTQKAACKPGYTPFKLTENGNLNDDFYYCIDEKKKNSKGVYYDPMHLFGGIYQHDDNSGSCVTGNKFLSGGNSCSCPGGYTAQKLIQAHWTEGHYFVTYVCQNVTAYQHTVKINGHQQQTSFFGGAYQTASGSQSSNGFENQYTKGFNCPAGYPDYKPYEILNHWACNQPTTCNTYWCLNNVYSLGNSPSVQPPHPPI